jgi:hypothetical protein
MKAMRMQGIGLLTLCCIVCIVFGAMAAAQARAATFPLIVEPEGRPAVAEARIAEAKGLFRTAARWQKVELSPRIAPGHGIAPGDELIVNLFADAAYLADVDRVSVNVQGTITVRGRLRGYPLGHLLISTTGGISLGSIHVPELGAAYTILYDPDSKAHYLLDHDPAQADELQEAPAVIPPWPGPEGRHEIEALPEYGPAGQAVEDSTATVDVMAVYTPAAKRWADAYGGGIDNVIAQAMEKAQLVADNSATGLIVRLVHSAEVSYTESGDSEKDLNRLQGSQDGYLESVHTLRDTHAADLVALFTQTEDAGGIAYLLEWPFGMPAYAFSISRVQQAGRGYTTIHEIGHNMGLHHHKDQNYQPGPGLYSYSAGWRWIGIDGKPYCSVMAYEEGMYYADARTHTRVPYFSNPGITYSGVATGHAADGDNARTARGIKSVVAAYRRAASSCLYFPHVAATSGWHTEIGIINSGDQEATGTLKAYSDAGRLVQTRTVILAAHGRVQMDVADAFADHAEIGYLVLDTGAGAFRGYAKLYREGVYRTAIPAARETVASNLYIPHIAADGGWWTAVSLVNTTAATKELTIAFNNGQSIPMTLEARQHKAFDLASLFDQPLPPDIQWAMIGNAGGVVGLELFGGSDRLDGILLTGNTASSLYCPHVADADWWTGIAACNPSGRESTLTITPYNARGSLLARSTLSIAGMGQYSGTLAELALPAQTAWFRIDSTERLSGFELFGAMDGSRIAAYGGEGGAGAPEGLFPKIEQGGWTGIAFVNTEGIAAAVTLTAYDDGGGVVATQGLKVGAHAQVVQPAEAIFSEDISGATYMAYRSSRNMAGFQLNGSADGTMLDGLPALAGAD